jgi:hypothetical protein
MCAWLRPDFVRGLPGSAPPFELTASVALLQQQQQQQQEQQAPEGASVAPAGTAPAHNGTEGGCEASRNLPEPSGELRMHPPDGGAAATAPCAVWQLFNGVWHQLRADGTWERMESGVGPASRHPDPAPVVRPPGGPYLGGSYQRYGW